MACRCGAVNHGAERAKYNKEHGDAEFKKSKDLPVLKVRNAGLHKAVELYKEALDQARHVAPASRAQPRRTAATRSWCPTSCRTALPLIWCSVGRAHVSYRTEAASGNWRRVIDDCTAAKALLPSNIKIYWRAVCAAVKLDKHERSDACTPSDHTDPTRF